MNPDLGKHFKAFIALAPVLFLSDMHTALIDTVQTLDLITLGYQYFGSVLLLPDVVGYLARPFVKAFPNIFLAFVNAICGFDEDTHMELSHMPIMFNNDVGGTSMKDLLHLMQFIKSGKVQYFDYGTHSLNMREYGQKTPPEYDLSQLKHSLERVPMLLFTGTTDYMISDENFRKLLDVLGFSEGNTIKHVNIEDYNHVDYMWAKDADFFVNSEVRQFLLNLI